MPACCASPRSAGECRERPFAARPTAGAEQPATCLELQDSVCCGLGSSSCCGPTFELADVASGGARKARPVVGRLRLCRQERRGLRRGAARVPERLMRVAVPGRGELAATLAALEAVQAPGDAAAEGEEVAPRLRLAWGAESKDWDRFLGRILGRVAGRLREELGEDTVFSPVRPEEEVRERFLKACAASSSPMTIGYHGTKAANFESIARRGLLVPGSASGVKVANGSAHGVGVYTARLGKASLSKGFSESDALFVCAICDTALGGDAEPWVPSSTRVMCGKDFPAKQRLLGRFTVGKCSDEVLHVGDAIVVFKDAFVVPLFLASRSPGTLWERPQQVGRRRFAVPPATGPLSAPGVQFPGPGRPRVGETVWAVPLPFVGTTSAMKVAKRRLNRRVQDKEMRGRSEKFWDHLSEFESSE